MNATKEAIVDYENSMGKLLLYSQKCSGIVEVMEGKKKIDDVLPICIELHLTNLCNLKCDWCIDKELRKKEVSLSFENSKLLLNEIAGKNVGITIEGGGEPTLYPQFSEFIELCIKNEIPFGLITNGTNKIEKDLLPKFSFIRISLDASTPQEYLVEKGKDYFDRVIENIRYIRENAPDLVLGVSYVLNKRNSGNLELLFKKLRNLNLNYIRLRNVEENSLLSHDKDSMQKVIELVEYWAKETGINISLTRETNTNITSNKNLPCIAHSLRALIVATGDVYLCSKRKHDPIIIGNINNQSFYDIWRSEERERATEKLKACASQNGCTACRITKYNELFYNLSNIKTKNFI